MESIPSLATTAIGSVPFRDVDRTLDIISRTCPEIPHLPQMVNLSPWEDMVLGAVDGLPLLEVDEAGHSVHVLPESREQALTEFYERFLSEDIDYFHIPQTSTAGLAPMLRKARAETGFGPRFLKAQVIGPISFGLTVRTPDDKNLIDDPELADTLVKGLGSKAAWLANQIRETGRWPIIFIDEPGLSGFGSAFSTLEREQVISILNEAIEITRAGGDVLVGTHVCGNTDWGMLTDTKLDIINFDAYAYMEHFLLYARKIEAFLDRGGLVAWGLVPTKDFTGNETAQALAENFRKGLEVLEQRGLDTGLVRASSIITPSCGMGTMSEDNARACYKLLAETAGLVRE